MRSILFLFAAVCSFFLSQPYVEAAPHKVIEVSQLNELNPYIKNKTLLFIDLDNTVFCSTTALGSMEWAWDLYQKEKEKGMSSLDALAKAYPQWMKIQEIVRVKPMEESTVEWIKHFQENGGTILAATSREPAHAGVTLKQLHSIGLDFSQAFPGENFQFNTDFPALYADGVLYTNGNGRQKKSEVIDQFLTQLKDQSFDAILFLDDDRTNAQQVAEMAEAKHYPIVSLRYTAADGFPKLYRPEIASKQQEYAYRVLPDPVAEAILKTPAGQKSLALYRDPVLAASRMDRSLVGINKEKADGSSFGKVSEMTSIRDLLNLVTDRTLVVFDLNDTLITPLTYLGNDTWADAIIKQHVSEGMPKEEVLDRLVPDWHRILIAAAYRPVESDTVSIFQLLQSQGCCVIGLTSRYVEMAYPTLDQLRSVGIDFSANRAARQDLTLHLTYPAKFLGGVIFAGLQNSKKQALLDYLRQNPIDFDQIIFVDDKKKNAEEIASLGSHFQQPVLGVWYRAIEKQFVNKDPDIAKIQYVFFERILPNDIAETLK